MYNFKVTNNKCYKIIKYISKLKSLFLDNDIIYIAFHLLLNPDTVKQKLCSVPLLANPTCVTLPIYVAQSLIDQSKEVK